MPLSVGRDRPDLRIAVLLFIGLVCVYTALQRAITPTYDASIYMQVARSLYDDQSLLVHNDPYLINTPYASYGLGLSIAILPLVALQEATRPDGQGIILLTNVLVVAATATLLFALARISGFERRWSLAAALVFGFTTMAVQQSTDLFSEPGVGLFVVLAVFGLAQWRRGVRWGPALAGTGIALAITFRSDSIFMVMLVLVTLPLFVPWSRLRHAPMRWLLPLGVPVAAGIGYQLAYNQFRYGTLTQFGYKGYGFTTPFWTGLTGNLTSPGKGFFVFNSLLLLSLPGLVLLWRRDRGLAAALIVLSVIRPLFYARWVSWEGGVGWGPRFMYPLCALLTIPTIETIRWIARWRSRWRSVVLAATAALAMVSAAVALLGVMVPFEQWFNVVTGNAGVAQTPEQTADRVHDYYWTFPGNHVAGNLRLIDMARPFPLKWFSEGHRLVGPTLATLGVLLVAAAAIVALRSDVIDPQQPPDATPDGLPTTDADEPGRASVATPAV
jgi:4-amino-4-deoxy-L-arabinose transferase-like glycosyltransferase